jgi:DNA polymerase III delta prime subunit
MARQQVCTSWLPLSQSACPLEDDAVAKLEDLLNARLAGQTLAALAVRKAIAQNVERYRKGRVRKRDKLASYVLGFPHSIMHESNKTSKSTKRPETLFLHFSGPTGVGKSLTANLISQALFDPTGKGCGAISINLNELRSFKPWLLQSFLTETLQTFKDQLALCPRSVFVLDEIQSVHRDIVDELVGFFLPHGMKKHGLSVAYAVVILISDLGSERLEPNMARADAVTAISAAAQSRFGSGGGGAGKDATTENVLMRNLVPFLPLSKDELAQVAVLQLGTLLAQLRTEFGASWRGKLTWQPQVAQAMADSCFQEKTTCYSEGGRGIESKVHHDLQGDVEALIVQCLNLAESEAARGRGHGAGGKEGAGRNSALCFDNVDVRVARRERKEEVEGERGEHGELEVVLDAVYGKDEFEGYHERKHSTESFSRGGGVPGEL